METKKTTISRCALKALARDVRTLARPNPDQLLGIRKSAEARLDPASADRYDADPQVLGDDFGHRLELRDDEGYANCTYAFTSNINAAPPPRPPRPLANPDLFKGGEQPAALGIKSAAAAADRKGSPTAGSAASRQSSGKWQLLASVEPKPADELEDHDPFSLGDSDEEATDANKHLKAAVEAATKDAKPAAESAKKDEDAADRSTSQAPRASEPTSGLRRRLEAPSLSRLPSAAGRPLPRNDSLRRCCLFLGLRTFNLRGTGLFRAGVVPLRRPFRLGRVSAAANVWLGRRCPAVAVRLGHGISAISLCLGERISTIGRGSTVRGSSPRLDVPVSPSLDDVHILERKLDNQPPAVPPRSRPSLSRPTAAT